MNLKFWTWPHNSRMRKMQEFNTLNEAFISALTESLRHTQIGVSANHHITYAQRPPAPRPIRLTVVYVMQDGMEYKEFVPLTGQMSWHTNFPHYVEAQIQDNRPPQYVRYEFGYEDGGHW